MKKLPALLLSLLMLFSALPVHAQETDPAALYPAAPIPMEDYCALYDEMLAALRPDMEVQWYAMTAEDGSIVLTNSVSLDGVPALQLTIEGSMVTGAVASAPYYTDDVQLTADLWSTWSVIAAVPFAMYDGLSFDEAFDRCGTDFDTLMSRTNAYDVCPIYGMEAQISREPGVIRMHYILHGDAPAPVATAAAGSSIPAFSAYRDALDVYAAPMLEGGVVWTAPEDMNGMTLIGVDNMGDNPSLVLREDEILMLMTLLPFDAQEPQQSYLYCLSINEVMVFVPLLMAQGMTAEEAEAAAQAWYTEAGFRAGVISAMSGTPYTAQFCGASLELTLREDGAEPRLAMYLFCMSEGR